MKMDDTGLFSAVRRHILALLVFPALSLAWVGDTLVRDYDLSAFDVIFRLPHWKAEYEYRGVQQLLLSDSPQAHYPERAFKWRATRNGERIDFNPYIFTGVPDQSQGVGAFMTSPFQLFMDITEAIDWSTWFRLAVAGLFMYAFLIVLGLSPYSAILGGVLWAFNFHQLAWLEFPQHLATQLWIPVLFLFNYSILRWGLTWQNLLGVVITNALFYTSGYTQIVLYTYVAIGVFNTVYLAVDARMPAMERLRRWLLVHGAFVLAALVLVPKLVVDIQVLTEGLRGQQQWRLRTPELGWGIQPLLLTIKNMMPDIADYKRFFSANYFGGIWGERHTGREYFGNIVTASTYCGVAIFILIPFTLRWLTDPARRPILLAACAVLLFAFAMIHKDPLMINAFNLIPMSGYAGYERYLTIITFMLSILAAAGLHILIQLQRPTSQKVFWGVFVVVLTSPLWMQILDPSIMLHRMWYPAAVLLGTGTAAAILCYCRLWRHVPIALLAVAILDLLVVTHDFNPRMAGHRNFPTTPTIDLLLEDQTPYRTAEVSTRQLYPPNILQYYGVPSIGGYSTVALDRYLEFVDNTIDDYHVTANGQLFFFDMNYDVFRLLNVKYLLSENELTHESLNLVREAPGYRVYELVDHLPRVYCASDLLNFQSDKELLGRFRETAGQFDRPMAVVSEVEENRQLTRSCQISDIRAKLDGVEFTVATDQNTYVLAPYNYSENWKALSEDHTLPVLRANYAFIAVAVEPGMHRVKLRYEETDLLSFSYVLTGLGLFVLCWFFVSRSRTPAAWLLMVSSLVVILYSLLELPSVRNDDLPERLERHVVLTDDT